MRNVTTAAFLFLGAVAACDDSSSGTGGNVGGPGLAPTPPPGSPAPAANVPAAPLKSGELDPTFGIQGKVTDPRSLAKKIALQSDGKLLVVGAMTLSRYNADGSIDAGFGIGGHVTVIAKGGPLDAMQSVAVQGDGKIVVAGFTAAPTDPFDDIALLRYSTDGKPDDSFGSHGLVTTDIAGSTDRAYAVLVQPDNKIVIAGIATLGTMVTPDQDLALLRYLTNGDPDLGFGTGGRTTTNVAGKADFGYAVALQADGKIVVAGRVGPDGGSDPDFGVVRYTVGGEPDASFGGTGVVRMDTAAGAWDEAGAIAVQNDGKIVVGGYLAKLGVYQYALARLTTGGAPDEGFGTHGIVSTSFTEHGDYAHGLAVQADGKIVLAGQLASLTQADFGVARYTPAGVLDASFGTGGHVAIDFFGKTDNANDVVIDASGRIVVAGSAKQDSSSAGLAMVRLGQ